MEVKEFVRQTLVDIAAGMEAAHREIKGEGVSDTTYTNVEFDIAITVENQSGTSGGGKLSVAQVFSLGGEIQDASKNINVSRVKFNVQFHVRTKN